MSHSRSSMRRHRLARYRVRGSAAAEHGLRSDYAAGSVAIAYWLQGVPEVVACDGLADCGAGGGGEPEVNSAPDPRVGDLGDELVRVGEVPFFGAGRRAGDRDIEPVWTEQMVN